MGVVGIDEAGKGPVIGPMIIAAVRLPAGSDVPASVVDSKRLDPADRTDLAARIQSIAGLTVSRVAVPVDVIDNPGTDMNSLTVAGQAAALNAVAEPEDTVIADAGDVDSDRFARRIADRAWRDVAIVAEHGADDSYPVVSAASILAKVRRDAEIAGLANQYGAVGSGYPSDPTTQEFLRDWVDHHGTLPDCARASWATSKEVLARTDQTALGEFHHPESE